MDAMLGHLFQARWRRMGSAHELSKDQYINAIRENSALLLDVARRDLKAPVPTCPGWFTATLVAHIGEVQRFWAFIVRTRAQEPVDMPDSEFDACPGLLAWYRATEEGPADLNSIPAGLVEWAAESTTQLLAAFEPVEPGEQIWHWSGDNRALTNMRNQAMEATVHRYDAQNAQGAASAIDPDIALDGIAQHFDVQIPAIRHWNEYARGQGETYHFHRTDGPGEWLVTFNGEDVAVRAEHAKGDIALRGSAEDLFLWLWGRISADRLDVHGNAALLERYRQLVPASS
jgi:uncharacterized protein (TIGR03083 family)